MEPDDDLREANRDRERYIKLGFGVMGVPMSNRHEDQLANRAAGVSQIPPQDYSSSADDDFQPAETARTSNAKAQNALSKPKTRPNASANVGDKKDKPASRASEHIDPAAPNEIDLEFKFVGPNGEKTYKCLSLLDTGVEDNWISETLVEKLKLSRGEDHVRDTQLVDFNGQGLVSQGLVKASWRYNHRFNPMVFRIAPASPRDVIFGFRTLFACGLMKLNQGAVSKPAGVLVPTRPKPDRSKWDKLSLQALFSVRGPDSNPRRIEEEKNIERKKAELDKEVLAVNEYREWRTKKRQEGYKYDASTNQFVRKTADGMEEFLPVPWSFPLGQKP